MSAPTLEALEAVMEWRNLDHNAAQVRADSRDDLIVDGLRPDRQLIGGHLLVPIAAEQGGRDGTVGPRRARHVDDHVVHHHPAERSEEHTSELQSHLNIVCRLLLEKKKKKKKKYFILKKKKIKYNTKS